MNAIYRYRPTTSNALHCFKCAFLFICVFHICSNKYFVQTEFLGSLSSLSLKDCKVYGPGLQANFTVPVRYFFIQLIDSKNSSYTSDLQKLVFQVNGLKQRCHVWYQLLHIENGLFVARYRLYETCFGIKIDILYDNNLVAQAPYIIEGILFHEQCYCPKPMDEWLSALNCPSSYSQIERDLSIFAKINMQKVRKEVLDRFNYPNSYSFCHYSVTSNQVYRECFGQHVGFSMFMDEILLSLSRKVYLPDMEFIANLGDWPLEQKSVDKNPVPIFSWCGSESTKDIVLPTYDITEATLEMMGRVMVDILSIMGNSRPSWSEKIKTAFWRGRDSRQERLDLIKIARKHPEIFNASLINFFFYRDKEKEYGPKSEYISFFDFFKYKYQINIDGMVAAYRMPYLLAGGSLVLKQDSEFYEHFYGDLEPMVHYVPFKRNLSNLVDQLQWSMSNDEKAKEIAYNAREYALSHLMPRDILCYYAVAFREYSKKLETKSKIFESMELVKQPLQKNCICSNEENTPLEKEEL